MIGSQSANIVEANNAYGYIQTTVLSSTGIKVDINTITQLFVQEIGLKHNMTTPTGTKYRFDSFPPRTCELSFPSDTKSHTLTLISSVANLPRPTVTFLPR